MNKNKTRICQLSENGDLFKGDQFKHLMWGEKKPAGLRLCAATFGSRSPLISAISLLIAFEVVRRGRHRFHR